MDSRLFGEKMSYDTLLNKLGKLTSISFQV